ncbi:substrate-binding domain-containing protein [Nonomuraea insulae]|uniref:Substrate-binding domain-containing protein n=1 Tax=Nonomuraea insulae TaxID=1616787 RepID=A0ABW1D6Q1_9ACTN
MARTLKQQVSTLIGVLVTDLRNPFYAELAAGIEREARQNGYAMMLVDACNSAEVENNAALEFVGRRVSGVILTPSSAAVSVYLKERAIPVVEIDRQFAAGSADGVIVGNRMCAREATDHLIMLGHRRIALFIDDSAWTTGSERRHGYRDALAVRGIAFDPDLVLQAAWDVGTSYSRALNMLRRDNRPSAVLACNNVLAEGVWRAVTELGLRVPGDLSLVAFDDVPWMSLVTPGVSTVVQDATRLGAVAVGRLLHRLTGADPESVTTV